jgi:hypothetical protein
MKAQKKPSGNDQARRAKDKDYVHYNSQFRLSPQEIKQKASYRWLEILSTLAPALRPALEKPGKHVPCPVHGGRDGFRLFKDVNESGGGICNTCGSFRDGFAVLRWVNGWSFRQSLEAVSISLGLIPGRVISLEKRPPKIHGKRNRLQDAERRRKNLLAVWEQSTEIRADDPAHKYLCRRIHGIEITEIPSLKIVLRYHARLPYYEDFKLLAHYPALIAAIQNVRGRVVTLHRTYISKDREGKAPVSSPKKVMPPVIPGGTRGAAVKLFPVCGILGLTEGIETALGVHAARGLPVWACVSANGLEAVELPSVVREVAIFGDNDISGRGQEAARNLEKKLLQEGRKVDVLIPEKPGTDWLDVYIREVRNG